MVAASKLGGHLGETHIMNTPRNWNESRIANLHRNFQYFLWLGFLLALPGTLCAQTAPTGATKTLVVNGKTVEAGVRQIDGHSYVDVETLAQITNGAVFIEPTRVVLKIPASTPASGHAPATTSATTTAPAATATPAAAAPAPAATEPTATATVAVPASAATNDAVAAAAAAAAPVAASAPAAVPAPAAVQTPQGLSRTFASTAIAALADMREWRAAISTMITHGLAVSDGWAQGYRDQAQADLAQAEVAATTDADHNAVQLLRNEFGNLTSWTNGVLAARQDLNGAATIDPDALKNDTSLERIRSCSQFLNSMLVSGDFADNASCH